MAIIIPGWQVLVMSGDVFSGLTVGLSGGYLADIVVESGGMVIDTAVSTSGYLELDPGAVAIGTVNSAGAVLVDGAVLSDTLVLSGTVGVESGGMAIDTVLSGSVAPLLYGSANLGAGGSLAVRAGGSAGGTPALGAPAAPPPP